MSPRFTLYYWPIPFRAQFARYILTYAGEAWHEPDRDAVVAVYNSDVADQPLPFMGPPLLHDQEGDVWISQSLAICNYLGEVFDLMPGNPAQDALTRKVLGDCLDVIHALTSHCGTVMWTDETWAHFAEARLPRWLQIFEEIGARHSLQADSGTLLGTSMPGVADLACGALWVTIKDTLPDLQNVIAEHAPNVFALSNRVADTPAIAALREDQRARWGNVWCEGQIEASLRSVLASWRA